MINKVYIKKHVFIKDAPKDVQQTLRELGFNETFDFGQTFGDFLKEKRNRCRIYRGKFR